MARRRTRILMVEASLRDNGGLRVNLDLLRRWTGGPVQPRLFVLQQVQADNVLTVDGSVAVTYGADQAVRLRQGAPAALARLVRACRDSDVVVSGSEIGLGPLLAYTAARATRRPFAVMVHALPSSAIRTWVPPLLRPLTWHVLAHADVATSVSADPVAELVAAGLPPERIAVVPNGIDVESVRARAAQPSPLPGGPRDVVSVGRLASEKGYDVLIRAHALVRRAGLEHRLVILGEGPARAELERLSGELGVPDTVLLPGAYGNPFPILAQAQLFVLSSHSEGFSMALLEAVSLGVPAVATRCGAGPVEILDGGQLGRLVPPGSPEALAEAISAHLLDPEPLRAAIRPGKDHARRFDIDEVAERHVQVLTRAARRQPLPEQLRAQVHEARTPVASGRRPEAR